MIQSEGLLTHYSLYLMGSLSPYRMKNSNANLYVKELKNTDATK